MSEFLKSTALEKAADNVGVSAEEMKKDLEKKVENLSNVNQLLHYLKAKDIGGMVGAITAIFSEYFSSKVSKKNEEKREEKGKKPKNPHVYSPSAEVAQKKLNTLKATVPQKNVENKDQSKVSEDLESKEVKEGSSIDRPGSEVVYIGASIMQGFAIKSKNSFIGKGGVQSKEIFAILEKDRSILEGKKAVVIQGYGNDLAANKSSEEIMPNMEKIVKLCSQAGIQNISIVLRLPYGNRLNDPKKRGRALKMYESIKEKWGSDDSVKIIDLYSQYVDPNTGYVKEEYESGDPNHLWGKAYEESLFQIAQKSGIPSAEKVKKIS